MWVQEFAEMTGERSAHWEIAPVDGVRHAAAPAPLDALALRLGYNLQ